MAPDDPPEILTPRLRLRALAPADAEPSARMMTPAVSQWTATWPVPTTTEVVLERLERARQRAAAGNGVMYAIERRSDAALMGWIGLSRSADEPGRAILGYWLGEAFHGQGYGGEAAQAVTAAGWTLLDVQVIEAGAKPGNAASIAIIERLGMHFTGERSDFVPARAREEIGVYYEMLRPPGV